MPAHIFETKVQELQYKVLREVARHAWQDTLLENILNIPQNVVPGNKPTMRCCVYKERAILSERVKVSMGGDRSIPNVIQVIESACDECPAAGYSVTNSCRGCLAHRCEDACRKGAIWFDHNHEAHIDKTKCIECGMCAKVCPFTAIVNRKRPCQNACKIKAISIGENGAAKIDNDKCISCGACAYQCPFGAIRDKSYILNVIDMLRGSRNGSMYKVIAVVAPAIASQFSYAKLGQIVAALKQLGFSSVMEVALGADIVAKSETKELAEKGFITSSCCPAFVLYIKRNFPDLVPMISHNPSPMAAIAQYLKQKDPECKVVFIGPCTAKKMEARQEAVRPYVNEVLTFLELQALIDSRDIDVAALPEQPLDDASYYGRIFARSGGLAEAVAQGLKEIGRTDFQLDALACNGIEECHKALLLKSKNALKNNFIEGMACIGGCVGGSGCLTHAEKNRMLVDKHGKEARNKSISESLSALD